MKKLDKAIIKYHRLLAEIESANEESYKRALQRELKRTGSKIVKLSEKHKEAIQAYPYTY